MLRPPSIKRLRRKYLPAEIFERYFRQALRDMARFYLQQGGDPALELGSDVMSAIVSLGERIVEGVKLPSPGPWSYFGIENTYNFPHPWALASKLEIQYFGSLDVSFIPRLKSCAVKKLLSELISRMIKVLPIETPNQVHEWVMDYDTDPEYDAGKAETDMDYNSFCRYISYLALEPGWTDHVRKQRLPRMRSLTPPQRVWIERCLRLLDTSHELRQIVEEKSLYLDEYHEHARPDEYFYLRWGDGFLAEQQFEHANMQAAEGWWPVIVIKTKTPEDMVDFVKVVSFFRSLEKLFWRGDFVWT